MTNEEAIRWLLKVRWDDFTDKEIAEAGRMGIRALKTDNCAYCRHNGKQWFEVPCDSCRRDRSRFELADGE